jgi:radical SAM superfamily enzyme YgiQ (UPF0313 family)
MYAAGFRFLKFGLESGNPRILNIIKKVRAVDGARDGYRDEKEFPDRLQTIVPLARRIGFRIVAGAIFGLPGEGLPDAIETLDILMRLDVDEYYHNFLQLFPGTEAFATYQRWGYECHHRRRGVPLPPESPGPRDPPSCELATTEWRGSRVAEGDERSELALDASTRVVAL